MIIIIIIMELWWLLFNITVWFKCHISKRNDWFTTIIVDQTLYSILSPFVPYFSRFFFKIFMFKKFCWVCTFSKCYENIQKPIIICSRKMREKLSLHAIFQTLKFSIFVFITVPSKIESDYGFHSFNYPL